MGKVTKQAEADLDAIMKLAAKGYGMHWTYLKTVAKPLLGILGGAGVVGATSYYLAKKDKERHDQDLFNSMKTLANRNPDLMKDPTQFVERFGELTVISPTIAKNPTLAAKLLQSKLIGGFDVDDIHKLTSIEANTSRMGGLNPDAAGRAGAASALNTLVQTFGHDIVSNINTAGKDLHSAVMGKRKTREDAIRKEHDAIFAAAQGFAKKGRNPGQTKEGSVQRVSDECLGEMLAERYMLIKEAGFGNLLAKGTKSLGTGLTLMLPAIALGGGIELVRQAIESRRNAALEAQADHNFRNIMKSSDLVRGNPEQALEIFNTLKAVAPSLAARSLVAQTFIEHTVGTEGHIPPQTISALADAENQVRGLSLGKGTFVRDLQTTMMGLADPKKTESFRSLSRPKLKKGVL